MQVAAKYSYALKAYQQLRLHLHLLPAATTCQQVQLASSNQLLHRV